MLARDPLSIVSREINVRKKPVNANALLFRATALDLIPIRAQGMTSGREIPQRRCKPVLNSPHVAVYLDAIYPNFRPSSSGEPGPVNKGWRVLGITANKLC